MGATRGRILGAAAELIAMQGVAGTSIDNVRELMTQTLRSTAGLRAAMNAALGYVGSFTRS